MVLISKLTGQYLSSQIDIIKERLLLLAYYENTLSEKEALLVLTKDPKSSIIHVLQNENENEIIVYGQMLKNYTTMVQNKTVCKVIKGTISDILNIFGKVGYESKKEFHRKGHQYNVPQIITSRLIVKVQVYQLFEINNSEQPLHPPGMWIIEAQVDSTTKEGLIDAEIALRNVSSALEDLVELKNLYLKPKN